MPYAMRAEPGRTSTEHPRVAIGEMAEGLRQRGGDVTYETSPEQGQGDMIRVSLGRALQVAARPVSQPELRSPAAMPLMVR